MKKTLAACALILALTTALSVPASAVAIITGESFTKSSKNDWEDDRYAPEEFDFSDNQLYLALGKTGYYKARPTDQKDKYYAQQGKKLEVETPRSTTWTATVKLNVDDTWMSTSSNRKRAEFRVDLMDSNGKPIEPSPAIALIKGGAGAPVFKFVNPKAKAGGWGMGDKFINGDKESENLYIEEGWHTLIIKSTKGVISYYIDEKKIGNCTLTTTDVLPTYMAISAYNYERPDVTNWDNCYLYDGAYSMPMLSSSQQDKRDDTLTSRYASKRASWIKRYTEYYDASGKKVSSSVPGGTSKLTKEMPDSYWDY